MGNRIVKVVITGDSNSLKRAMSSSERSLQGLNKTAAKTQGSLTSMEKAMGTAMKATAVIAGGAVITGALKSVVDAASDSEQAFGALDAVFQEQSGAMRDYADASIEMGLSHGAYAKQAALLGSLLKNLGTAQADLVPTTSALIEHATDLAATYGGTTADAVNALGSAFKGQFNPMEAYGAALRAADVSALQAAEGISKSEAIIKLVMEQTSDAVGQAERETDTFAATQERAAAAADSAKAALGQGLLPVYSNLAGVVESAATAFGSIPKPLISATANIALAVAGYKLMRAGVAKTTAALAAKSLAMTADAAATRAAATANGQYVLSLAEMSASSKAAAWGALSNNLGKIAAVGGAAALVIGGFAYAAGKAAEAGADAATSADEFFDALQRGVDIASGELQTGDTGWWTGQIDAAYELQAAFDQIDTNFLQGFQDGGIGNWITTGSQLTTELNNQVEALSRLAEVDPAAARDGLLAIKEAAEAAGISAEELDDILPGLAPALESVGTSADSASDEVTVLTAEFDAAKDAASKFKRGLDALLTGLSVEEEVDGAIIALRELKGEMTPDGIKGNTDAVLANRAALRKTASELRDVTVAQIENGASVETVMAKYRSQRKSLIGTMVSMGISKKAARAYANELLGTPEDIETLYESNAPEKEKDAKDYNDELDRTPEYIETHYKMIYTAESRGYTPGSVIDPRKFTGGAGADQGVGTAVQQSNTTVVLDGERVAVAISRRTDQQHRELYV